VFGIPFVDILIQSLTVTLVTGNSDWSWKKCWSWL